MFSNYGNKDISTEPLASGSSLAALFGNDTAHSGSSKPQDVSLAYVAPRQPKSLLVNQNVNSQRKASKTEDSIVFCVKTITLTKQQSSTSSFLPGDHHRLGIALIGNDLLNKYELILYKDKQNVTHRTKVHSAFVFNLFDDDFDKTTAASAFFNDDNNVSLNVDFHNRKDCTEFGDCIKKKGGQLIINRSIVSIDKPLTTETPALLRDKESVLDKPETANINTRHDEINQNNSSFNMRSEHLTSSVNVNVNEIASVEQKVNKNICKKLVNEPFSYLSGPSRLDSMHIQSTYSRFPVSYNNASLPIHDGYNMFTADSLNTFMAENRLQNSEMRMHMLQMSLKLDTLLRDVSHVKDFNRTQTILKPNNKDLLECSSNLNQEFNLTINNLKRDNDELRKQLNSNDLDKMKLTHLIIENDKLKCNLNIQAADTGKNLLKIDDLNKQLSQIKVKMQESGAENTSNLAELLKTCEIQNVKVKHFEQRSAQLEKEKNMQQLHFSELEEPLNTSIKETMNKLYQNILSAFDDTTKYDVKQIEQEIAENLRNASYEIVQNVKKGRKPLETVVDTENKSNN